MTNQELLKHFRNLAAKGIFANQLDYTKHVLEYDGMTERQVDKYENMPYFLDVDDYITRKQSELMKIKRWDTMPIIDQRDIVYDMIQQSKSHFFLGDDSILVIE